MMKKFLTLLLFSSLLLGNAFAQGNSHIYKTLVHDGVTREYMIYVPQSYNPETPAPVVMALHCLGDSIQDKFFTTVGFDRIADRAG